MRMAFGLVSILVTVALILWLLAGPTGQGGQSYLQTTIGKGQQASQAVNMVSGKSADGRLATSSVKLSYVTTNGRDRLLISDVVIGGVLDVRYGLRKGDQLIQLGDLPVQGMVTDVSAGEAFLHDAFSRDKSLKVIREGKEIELPLPPAPASTQPTPETKSKIDNRSPLQKQLDGIQRIPSH